MAWLGSGNALDGFKQMLATKSKVWGPSAYHDDALVGTRPRLEKAEIDMILDFGSLLEAERVSHNSYCTH